MKTPYPFTVETVSQLVLALCQYPRFYQSVGYAVDPERVTPTEAAALVWGAQQVATTRGGEGCADLALALQEIETATAAGRMVNGTHDAACSFLESALARGVPDLDVLTAQVLPAVQYEMIRDGGDEVLKRLASTTPNNGPMIAQLARDMMGTFEKAAELSDNTGSAIVREGTFEIDDVLGAINGAAGGVLLPTGIPMMDLALGGGVESKTFNLYTGGTGSGKTGFLVHQFCEGLIQGIEGAYFSFELDEPEIRSKIYRNLAAMTRDQVRHAPEEAVSRLKWWKANGLARFWVIRMSAGTHVRRVFKELARLRRDHGANIRLLMLDYLDKMVGGAGSSWDDVERMADRFRDDFSRVNDGWTWSASQLVKGKSGAQNRMSIDDARGGAGKVHGSDLVLGGQRLDEDKVQDTVRFEVLKRRIGSGEEVGVIGPFPRDVERGRIVIIKRNTPWEANEADPSNAPVAADPTAGLVDAVPGGIPIAQACDKCATRLWLTPGGVVCPKCAPAVSAAPVGVV